jgi:hypothetical protein
MSIIDPPKSRFLFGLIVGAAIAVTGAALLENLASRKQRTLAASYLLEGYDFSGLRSKDKVWRGPQIGERIDLANLIERNGSTLENTTQQRPVMIATVSPSCGFCKIARDEMQYVQGQIALKNVRYYLVSFAPPGTDSDFYMFCDTLKISAPSFRWSKDVTPPKEALSKMITPSHVLIDHDGTVLRVWPGTSEEQSVRDGMGRQIVNDVSVILDTLEARSAGSNKTQ